MEPPVSDDPSETTAPEAPTPEAPTPAAAIPAEPAPPEPAPAEPVSAYGVGPTLRAARERMGKSLPDCSTQLRIRQPFLEALEDGRHRDLPGGTYAAGFLRTYAEFLGLDGEELLRRFRQEGAGGFAARSELSFPSPASEGRIPGGTVIFLGLVLAGLAYGGWYWLSSSESNVAELVPPLPERLSNLLARPAALTGETKSGETRSGETRPQSPAARPAEEPVKAREDVVPPVEAEEEKPPIGVISAPPKVEEPPPPPVAAATGPAQPEPVKPEPVKVGPEPVKPEPVKVEPEPVKTEPAVVSEPVAPTPAPAIAEGKVFGIENADSRVTLKAAGDDCWIQVREMDGSLLMSRLLRRGDAFRVPNRPGLSLMAGNAGALEVSIDGRKGPSLGNVGQVRRDIRLDPDRLSSGG